MDVIVIKYRLPYEDYYETVGIASNMEAAKRHVEYLKEKYSLAFNHERGKFCFEEYELIEK